MPSHPRIASAQLSSRWFAELTVADDVTEIVAIARLFVETWSAPEMLRLPFHCRPGRIRDAKHIQELAFLLDRAQQNFSGRLIDGLVLDRMLAFFAEASAAIERVAKAHGETPFLEGFSHRAAA
jgi:hypothetical protein